jgi:hypothetical protein
MRNRILRVAPLALLLLWPGLATGADLTIWGSAESEYDDNAFRSKNDREDDVIFHLTPGVRIHEDRGQDLLYSLEYRVPFEFAVDHSSELDDIDHFVTGRATYHLNDRTQFFVRERFGYLRGTLRDETTVDGQGGTAINSERDRVLRNDAEGGVEYQFSPRLLGTARMSHELFEIDRDDRADNWLLQGSADLLYALTPKHQVGGGIRGIRQEFDATTNIVGSKVVTYNVFAQWLWQISETLDLSMSVGPSYIENDQDDGPGAVTGPVYPNLTLTTDGDATGQGWVDQDRNPATGPFSAGSVLVSQIGACDTLADGTRVVQGSLCAPAVPTPTTALVLVRPTDPNYDALTAQAPVSYIPPATAKGDDSNSVNVFGEAVLRKRWSPTFQSALRYSRTQAGASGLGGAVIQDEINLSNNWDVTERWQIFVRGDWSFRQSINEATSIFGVAEGDTLSGTADFAMVTGLTTVRGTNTDIDTMRWGVAGRLTRLFTRTTSGWVQLTYNEQDSKGGTLGRGSDFENFLASVGVRHVFAPIKLW